MSTVRRSTSTTSFTRVLAVFSVPRQAMNDEIKIHEACYGSLLQRLEHDTCLLPKVFAAVPKHPLCGSNLPSEERVAGVAGSVAKMITDMPPTSVDHLVCWEML